MAAHDFHYTSGSVLFPEASLWHYVSTEIFQQKISTLLRDHSGTVVVMDEILIFGKDREEQDHNLRAVMQTVRASGLKLNKEKYQFGKSEINYFGHIVGKMASKPALKKSEPSQICPVQPTSQSYASALG